MLRNKRGQETGAQAAFLIALIGVLIVFYILFLPPSARRELLESGSVTPTGGPESGLINPGEQKSLLTEQPGRVSYRSQDIIEHNMGSVNLYTKTEGSAIQEKNSLFAERSVFTDRPDNMTFTIDDPSNAKNILLNFIVAKGEGILSVRLNGNMVFSKQVTTTNIEPIKLLNVMRNNILEFEVSSPGLAFWKRNQYILEKILVTADVTDITKQESKVRFIVTEEELENIETISLEYMPECKPASVGKLMIKMNDREIFNGIPDCGALNKAEFLPSRIEEGENEVTFSAVEGAYLIDRIKIKSRLKESRNPVYYFEIDKAYFRSYYATGKERCGEVDGLCPSGCDADEDIDCCFQESRDNFWCDVETDEEDDRCVAHVSSSLCARCSSVYEDVYGDAAEACEGLCGDDKDDKCPAGCNINYDKDCCWKEDSYWCDDVPIAGISSVCEKAVSATECDDCPKGYEHETEGTPDCEYKDARDYRTEETSLRSGVDVVLNLKFADTENKAAEIVINGRTFILDTNEAEWSRKINDYVESGQNSIKIVPKKSMDIRDLEVSIES